MGETGSALRPIDAGLVPAPTTPAEPGPAPQLQWLPIAMLRIDPAYQRPILRDGRKNIGRIAAAFRWARFAPVIVAPLPGGLYAIVDGQHRTTAAAARGFESVPCCVILADAREQAESFAAVNGAVTRMNSQAVFRARVAAGEPAAVAADKAARESGVTLLGYPVPLLAQKPGQTMCVGLVAEMMARHGDAVTRLVLRAAVAGAAEKPGMLTDAVLRAVLDRARLWKGADEAFIGRVAGANLLRLWGLARGEAGRERKPVWRCLALRLEKAGV